MVSAASAQPGAGGPGSLPPQYPWRPAAAHAAPEGTPTPATGNVSQGLAEARQQLQILATQLHSASAGPPELVSLVGRLRKLVALTLAVSPAAGRTPTPPATLGLLVSRIARLNRLLADLCRISPTSQQRLAPTLSALRSLWRHLVQERQSLVMERRAVGPMSDGGVRLGADLLVRGSAPLTSPAFASEPFSPKPAVAPLSGLQDVPAASTSVSSDERTVPAAATPGHGPRVGAPAAPHHRPRMLVAAPMLPILAAAAAGSAGAASSSAAGGVASAGAAGAALAVTVLAVALLSGLLSGRIDFDGAAPASALLGGRLERPG